MHFNNPELQAKAEEWSAKTVRPYEELTEYVMAGHFDEQVEVGPDCGYDDVKSGKVELIDG